MRSRMGWLGVGLAALVLAGCASSGKLARKSQEQLSEGDTRKAYDTALRAVAKDPYNAEATRALRASGQAVLAHEARRFHSLLAVHDTMAAAGVALDMDGVRHTVARHGVTLVADERQGAAELATRRAAAARFAADGHALFDEGRPKPAVAAYDRALRYTPDDPRLAESRRAAHEQATDRVLLMPYVCDTRTRLDVRALSDDMFASLTRYASEHLEFTELADPGLVWNRLFRRGPSSVTREAAYAIGEEREATRVAWSRIHGDRVDSHSQVVDQIVWRKVGARLPDGSSASTWVPVPIRVRIEDRWVSVAVESEVYSVVDQRIVARRTTDHGTGLRIVSAQTPLPGAGSDYALYTPEQWTADRAACRARAAAWSEMFGGLTVEALVGYARDSGKHATRLGATRHGRATRQGRSYDVCYGSLPGEAALMEVALADAWRELAAVLAESDRS